MYRLTLVLMAFCAVIAAAYADDEPMPPPATDVILAQTDIPALDAVDVAGRLLGVDVQNIPLNPVPPVRNVGDVEDLWASNSSTLQTFRVPAVLRAVGEHVYIWVERNAGITDAQAQAVALAFDQRIYGPVRDLWGTEAAPGIDGDPRLHILYAYNLGAGTAAYFAQRHTYPEAVISASNEREMFFVNLSAYGTNIATREMESTLAHEFQHMIRFNLNPNEDTWLNEGFSTFTEYALGYPSPYRYPSLFMADTNNQLNSFGLSGSNRGADYGAAFMFVTYFYHRYGVEGIRILSAQESTGLFSVDAALAELGGVDADTFFAEWAVANYVQGEDYAVGLYSYPPDLPINSRPSAPRLLLDDSRAIIQNTGNQYGTRYYMLDALQNARKLDVLLQMPLSVPLVPTTAFSGDSMWYGNRADTSNMTLTRAFDLSDVDSATLEFQTWYAIEEFWDYAYLLISTDDGATWDFLTSAQMTDADPFGNNYGIGYTGYSGDWLAQSIPLDAYVGGDVLIRFKYLTDDAVNEPGIVVDDIAIPEIGYFADFEADDGGWSSAGWVRIDNVLPQRAWVQIIEYAGTVMNAVTRWEFPLDAENWTLELAEGTTSAVIAVSPFAPVTTILAEYTLMIDVIE